MKIEYAATTSYTTLGDESDRSMLVELFDPAFTPLNQVEPLVGGTNSFKAPRGNMGVALQIVCSIPYATTAAALAGVKTVHDAFASKKHLKITQGATVHYYPNALLQGYRPVIKGVTIQHQLSFTTDDLTETAPS